MTLTDFYSKHQAQLKETLYGHIDHAAQDNPIPIGAQGLSMIRETIAEGKMIRGMLVLMSAQIHGASISDEQYHAAAALEILQAALLIHDDIADLDMTRRGAPSIYSRYITEGTKKHVSDPEHYGVSMAIWLGDLLFFLVTDIISRSVLNPEISRGILSVISRELQYVCSAQMLDISFGLSHSIPTEDEIDSVYTYKTAHYTFSLPLIVGGIFTAKHDEKTLRSIGREMGIIFQLTDDELGMFGTTEEIGKEVGSDIRENKKTLLRHLLFTHASPTDQQKLSTIFGNRHIEQADITYVKERLNAYKIPQIMKSQIDKRSERVEKLLFEYKKSGNDISVLQDLLRYIINRKK
ncbi:polyprenyl synthetase family protein [Candidatus Woesebacteria bacterium]|nr:polyprenyl synthetase family protein [Candidatus Woesebacteria bacterium]